jgi:hypothetical protein
MVWNKSWETVQYFLNLLSQTSVNQNMKTSFFFSFVECVTLAFIE